MGGYYCDRGNESLRGAGAATSWSGAGQELDPRKQELRAGLHLYGRTMHLYCVDGSYWGIHIFAGVNKEFR